MSSIHSSAFSWCRKLTSIYVWEDFASKLKSSTGWSFYSDKIIPMPISEQTGIYAYQYYSNSMISSISSPGIEFID